MESLLNLLYFLIGLAVGLWQLHTGQKQFEAQQREKMDEVRLVLAEIRKDIAVIRETSSSRSYDFQDKLIKLAFGPEAISDLQAENAAQVQTLVLAELERAGISDAVKRTEDLERKLASAFEINKGPLQAATRAKTELLTRREQEIIKALAEGISNSEIAMRLSISPSAVKTLVSNILQKLGVKNRAQAAIWYRDIMAEHNQPPNSAHARET